MAKLLCKGAQTCIYKRNHKGLNYCSRFELESECIHSVEIAKITKELEAV